ncbi:DUF3016 domain-containing protein [Dokdonella sp.]|uniref:DUF3016 domain-containing protein n=1 Tax=Dokdonella sp. TaxID=2291710 RepID=UPI002F40AF7B
MTFRLAGRGAATFAALWLATLASAAEPAQRVTVHWTDPHAFSDTRDNPGIRQMRPEEWLALLAKHLERRAEPMLPAGERLDVTFTDVDRAGRVEPWRGPEWNDVRIVKDIYPPRIDLRFTLTAADGRVIAEGERKLRDNAFLMRGTSDDSDALRFEKRLLDDWLRKEFQPAGH